MWCVTVLASGLKIVRPLILLLKSLTCSVLVLVLVGNMLTALLCMWQALWCSLHLLCVHRSLASCWTSLCRLMWLLWIRRSITWKHLPGLLRLQTVEMAVMTSVLPCLSRVPAVDRCTRLTRLPTPELPLTQALSDGMQVLGRQQLQQSMKHLIVPLGKKVPNLLQSRVVSAPPGVSIRAGCRTAVIMPVTAKAPLDLAMLSRARRVRFVLKLDMRCVTVVGRLLVVWQLEISWKVLSTVWTAVEGLLV